MSTSATETRSQTSELAGETRSCGRGNYVVRQGDCVESIAQRHGLYWETIWNDVQNAEVNGVRGDPNSLLPGDRLYVREKAQRGENAQTEQLNRFRRKGVPSKLRLIIRDDDDEPRANTTYVLEIDGALFTGKTGDDGKLEQTIPPDARKGQLTVGIGADQEEYEIDLGYIDPITEVSGVQARLNNLGFECGEVDGELGYRTLMALQEFQIKQDLPVNGKLDDATRRAIADAHGC